MSQTSIDKQVNMMIIGAQKAGTTSLYHYLNQHSDICFSAIKEITYFVDDEFYQKGPEYLESFFGHHQSEKVIASSFVHMLPDSDAPQRVHEYNPQMKIIICLREPIERAQSAYFYALKNGWEESETSFEDAFQRNLNKADYPKIRFHDLNYFENGLYYQQIQNWLKYFPREQLYFVKDTDLRYASNWVNQEIFKFLGVDSQTEVDTSKEFNKAGTVKSKSLQRFILSKNSWIKKLMGVLFPSQLKIWIRSRLVRKVENFNRVDADNPEVEITESMREFFKQDNASLKKEFKIEFNK